MKHGRFDDRMQGYVAALTLANSRAQSQKHKSLYRKVGVQAAGKRAGPKGAVAPKTCAQQSHTNNRRS